MVVLCEAAAAAAAARGKENPDGMAALHVCAGLLAV